jgi:hypothetical protein
MYHGIYFFNVGINARTKFNGCIDMVLYVCKGSVYTDREEKVYVIIA